MRPVVILGIALIILGVVALASQGISYTTREKVIDIGPIQATADKRHTLFVPPLIGALILAGGIVLVIAGSGQKS